MTEPEGGWPQQLDLLADEVLAATLAAEGLTVRHWHALRALAFGPMDALDLRDVLAPFAGPVDPAPTLAALAARGWVAPATGGAVEQTAAGREADARLFELVAQLRRTVRDGAADPIAAAAALRSHADGCS